jgi:myo-inositol-1(or 4)-monophosphatase
MLTDFSAREYLARMSNSLREASAFVRNVAVDTLSVTDHGGHDVITEVDLKINEILRNTLLGHNEGWLSEEDADDLDRLKKEVVWVVDPLDGTREFVDGVPEWSISIGLIIKGVAVAGAVCNPVTNELFLGSLSSGVTYNGRPARASQRVSLDGAQILASRQEYARGEWAIFEGKGFSVRPMGSVAYRLALVSAGLADASWTLYPRHAWDIAAGVALVNSAGGCVGCFKSAVLQFNRSEVILPAFIVGNREIVRLVRGLLADSNKESLS